MPDKQLPAHMQRVVQESQQLVERIEKLSVFTGTETYAGLPVLERMLICQQLVAMSSYAKVLEARIQLALDNNN